MHLATKENPHHSSTLGKFPSPSGDHAFSNHEELRFSLDGEEFTRFRPLQGIMHLATPSLHVVQRCL